MHFHLVEKHDKVDFGIDNMKKLITNEWMITLFNDHKQITTNN